MPMPVGGAFALRIGSTRDYGPSDTFDPEFVRFLEDQAHIQENLKCVIKWYKAAIPSSEKKISGVMLLEAKKTIDHCGMFILMKGLPLTQNVKKRHLGKKPLSNVKFTVLGSTLTGAEGNGEEEVIRISGGSRETYPLEFDIPEDLPPPLITSEGKLIYRMQVFVTTSDGRHVQVGESAIRLQGFKELTREEVDKKMKLEQEVSVRKGLLGLGRKRSVTLEWHLGKGAYLPGEKIQVELWGEGKEKLQVEGKVELVQKVWYQVPSTTRGGKMWVKMKVNVIGTAGREGEIIDVEGGERKRLWKREIQIPRGITPTFKFDFMNSVSYTIRGSVGAAGESREGWITGEVPVLIGTKKAEPTENDQVDGEEEDNAEEQDYDNESVGSPSTPSPVPPEELNRRRGSGGSTDARRSQSMNLYPEWSRPRAGSVSSMDSFQSLASSTLSIFRLPPSYSQLSSRRPTLETCKLYTSQIILQVITHFNLVVYCLSCSASFIF